MYSAQTPVRADALERATRRLAHRGPDGQRMWLSDDRRVGLGHARLSVIDLATGDQPIAGEDESLRIVVNREFYDFERTQRDLEGRGHRLRTRSDSEIALHLYEDYGTACLRYLRGAFAFVLWGGRNDTLFAVRDRFGIKPLFYTTYRGMLYLASEIKALLAAGVPASWDRAAFFQANHLLGTPHDRTLFEGIYPVSPGHYLLASGGQVRLIR
jgi:asparagine synthase (glutamine-hydrolysing)